MCLLDTTDGALMLSLYIQPAANFLPPAKQSETDAEVRIEQAHIHRQDTINEDADAIESTEQTPAMTDNAILNNNNRDPIAFLYYSIVLTTLTVMVALVIGVLQVLSLVLNVSNVTGPFWNGVQTASDYYDAIGGGICGCFIIVGTLSVVCYKPWRRWVGIDTVDGDDTGRGEDGDDEDIERQGETAVEGTKRASSERASLLRVKVKKVDAEVCARMDGEA